MHFSSKQATQSPTTRQPMVRVGLLISCLAIATLSACTTKQADIGNENAVVSSSSDATLTADASNTKSPVVTAAKGSPKNQFAAIIGTKQDGWLPKVLTGKGLKKGLTPAVAGKIVPGAEKVSEYGFSKVKVDNVPGLKQYEFYYSDGIKGKASQLEAVKLHFDPALNEAYTDLVKVASDKYGPAKPEDVKKEIIVWVGPEFVTAQITKLPIDFGGYQLDVSMEKD